MIWCLAAKDEDNSADHERRHFTASEGTSSLILVEKMILSMSPPFHFLNLFLLSNLALKYMTSNLAMAPL